MNTGLEPKMMNTLDTGTMSGAVPVQPLNPTHGTMTAVADNGMTLNIYSANGSRIEFYQEDLPDIENILSLLIQPRFITQPLLAIASQYNVATIPSHAIDLIRVQCSGNSPLVMPAGILTIAGVGSDAVAAEPGLAETDVESSPGVVTEFVEIHTTGSHCLLSSRADYTGNLQIITEPTYRFAVGQSN